MREIKFRAWTGKEMFYDVERNLISGKIAFRDESLILMQFTGLKDKNGKEIYGGDIVTNSDCIPQLNFQIKWYDEDGSARFELLCLNDEPTSEWYWLGEHYFVDDLEIIGNIYENPELLEGK